MSPRTRAQRVKAMSKPRDYLRPMRHYVYRHFDGQGAPLYVGCSKDVQGRFKQHMFERTYWAEQVARTQVTVHPDLATGRQVELEEITRLEPLHNGETYAMNTDSWDRHRFLVHGNALALGTYGDAVHPRSALGRLNTKYRVKFQRDLLDDLGPVPMGFRRLHPHEDLSPRLLSIESWFTREKVPA